MPKTTSSLRLKAAIYAKLEAGARERHESISQLAQRLIEEGLRIEEHPGVVFRNGASGRRAAVAHGPDVWQIIPAVRDVDPEDEQTLREAARQTGLTASQIRAAILYYQAYPDEIDGRIRRNDEIAASAEAEWRQKHQALLG